MKIIRISTLTHHESSRILLTIYLNQADSTETDTEEKTNYLFKQI